MVILTCYSTFWKKTLQKQLKCLLYVDPPSHKPRVTKYPLSNNKFLMQFILKRYNGVELWYKLRHLKNNILYLEHH